MFKNFRYLVVAALIFSLFTVATIQRVCAAEKQISTAAGAAAADAGISAAMESFKKDFPNTPVTEVRTSPIEGLYEILSDETILYYYPKNGHVIVGGMWSKEGKDLTGERRNELISARDELMSARAKDLPLEKAVRIGKGKKQIIEFTDPDCPFCRKADEYLKGRQDVTRYVFLLPIKQLHPDAEKKARYILCQKEPGKALEEVMGGKIDGKPYEVCDSKKVEEHIQAFADIGRTMNIKGTPMLIVNGHTVRGANIALTEQFLNEGNTK